MFKWALWLTTLILAMSATRAFAQSPPTVTPGSYEFHFDGYLQFFVGDFGSTLNKVRTPSGSNTIQPVIASPELHLRPKFDGETLNGFAYGAQAEFLMPRSDAGGGKTGTYGASLSTLHVIDVNRAYGYLGSLDAGYLRVGKTDSAFTLLQSGVIEAFGDGGQWTLQGGVASLLPRNAAPLATVVYADQPAVYSTFKLVYVFPAFHGISVMAGFEPESNGIKEGFSPNAPGQPREPMRSWRPGDAAYKRKNTVDAALSYAGNAGAVSYKVSAGALYGHAVDRLPPGDGLEAETGFNSLVVYQVGGQASYAGVTFGANLKGGQVEDNYGLQPAGARNALAYILGATYQLGPAILGASYFNSQSSGAYLPNTDVTVARTLSEYGAAAGANYIINQHLNLFLQYLYGHRHQPGNAELIAGNAQVQVIAAGGTFSW